MNKRTERFLNALAQTSESPMLLDIGHVEGICLYSASGKKYYDLISGICVSNLGHRNEYVKRAVVKQLEQSQHIMVYGEYLQDVQLKLAEKLSSILPEQLSTTYLVNTGTEAIEASMKLAKRYHGRVEIIACENSYHGSTQGSMSLMSNTKYSQAYRPLIPFIKFIQFNNTNSLERITSKTAGVFIDLVQGANGYHVIDPGFLKALRKRCDETGALLIFDEIQTGIGRTGKWFAMDHFDVYPDVLCLAKALGGGLPLGAFISSKKIMSSLKAKPMLGHITTFGGNPVSCAASIATLEFIENEQLLYSIEAKSRLFVKRLNHRLVKTITGLGLLLALEFESSEICDQVFNACMRNGVILGKFLMHNNSLRLTPPLTITLEEIHEVCSIINRSFDEIA